MMWMPTASQPAIWVIAERAPMEALLDVARGGAPGLAEGARRRRRGLGPA